MKTEQVDVKSESIYNDRICNRKLDQCQDSIELLNQNRESNSHFPSTLSASHKPNKNKAATEQVGAFIDYLIEDKETVLSESFVNKLYGISALTFECETRTLPPI